MHLRSRALGISVAFLLPAILGACASFETSQAKMQAFKTVGVISAIGDEFSYTEAGLTGFDTDDRSFAIASWHVDDLVVRQASAILSGRFQVQQVTYTSPTLARPEEQSPIALVNLMRDDRIKATLRTDVSPQALDAYIVIVKAKSQIGHGNRTVAGLGMVSSGTAFGSYAQIHALYEVRVYDGHSFELIEKRSAAPLDNADLTRLAGPNRRVDDGYLPSAGEPERNEKLHAAIVELIERSLPSTLQNLHLASGS